jgi:hypothetical protein
MAQLMQYEEDAVQSGAADCSPRISRFPLALVGSMRVALICARDALRIAPAMTRDTRDTEYLRKEAYGEEDG